MHSKSRIAKLGLEKPEISLYCIREVYFDILHRSGVTHECDRQTDGQMDG